MDLQLQNKAALVTGATAGIGLAIAQELAREGAAVIITGRARDRIERALDAIGNGAKGIVADLSTTAGTEPLFARLSRVDILVNNLGIYEPKAFVDIPDDDWLQQVDQPRGNRRRGRARILREAPPGIPSPKAHRGERDRNDGGVSRLPTFFRYERGGGACRRWSAALHRVRSITRCVKPTSKAAELTHSGMFYGQ
jgi:short chain dehydrogenase